MHRIVGADRIAIAADRTAIAEADRTAVDHLMEVHRKAVRIAAVAADDREVVHLELHTVQFVQV